MSATTEIKQEWIEAYQNGASLPELTEYIPEMRDTMTAWCSEKGDPERAHQAITLAEKSSIPFDVFCGLLLELIEIDRERRLDRPVE